MRGWLMKGTVIVLVGCGKSTPAPTVASVASHECSGGGTLNIRGSHLRLDTVVTLTSTTNPAMTYNATLPNIAVTCTGSAPKLDCTEIAATFGPVPSGTYNVSISNGGKAVTSPTNPITIGPDPLVVFADPDVAWNGVDTQIHVYVSQVAPPITKIQIAHAGGAAIDLLNLVTPVNGHTDQALATVPAGTAAGGYDVLVSDSGVCRPAVLPNGLTVVADTTLMLADITPKFGWRAANVSVTITAKAGSTFTELPRVYLLQGGQVVTLTSVARFSPTTLTAVVPKDPARMTGAWDVVVVNQDATVGRLAAAFTVTAAEPPVVDSISPSTVNTTSAATVVTVSGRNFSTPPPKVTLKCMDPGTPKPVAGAPIPPAPITPDQGPLTASGATPNRFTVTVDGTLAGYARGANCVVVVTNQDAAGAVAEFASLVMVPSQANLTGFFAGKDLNTGRRGLASVAGEATQSARFVYAIGGDNGGALKTIETLPVNIFGQPGAAGFFVQKSTLNSARTQLGAVRLGRFIYAVGGADTTALDTVERAAILDPTVHPDNVTADYVLKPDAGLGAGVAYYRVSAVMNDPDDFNPGGETLPSDAFGVRVPTSIGTNKLQVTLTWDVLANAKGYRVYRGVAPSAEELLVDTSLASQSGIPCQAVGTTQYQCTDSGAMSITPVENPLPVGSTGVWKILTSKMRVKRQGAAVTLALDPADATTAYIYVLGGKDAALTNTYEVLPITIAADGKQTPGTFLPTGATALPTYSPNARWKLRAWSEVMAGRTWLWVGGGYTDLPGTVVSKEATSTEVAATGVTSFNTSAMQGDLANAGVAGFGAFSLGSFLFSVGGTAPVAGITDDGSSIGPTPPLFTGWQSCQSCLGTKRTDMGAAVQSGYFWVISGETPTGISKTTEYVLY